MPQFFILDIRIDTSFSGQSFMIHIWNFNSLYGTSYEGMGHVNIRGGT